MRPRRIEKRIEIASTPEKIEMRRFGFRRIVYRKLTSLHSISVGLAS
jgi:hypothetical protein